MENLAAFINAVAITNPTVFANSREEGYRFAATLPGSQQTIYEHLRSSPGDIFTVHMGVTIEFGYFTYPLNTRLIDEEKEEGL